MLVSNLLEGDLMPHLRFRGLNESQVSSLSESLLPELATIFSAPEGDFTFEKIETTFFYRNQNIQAYPFVEVLWFDRGQAVQDKAAKIITIHCQNLLTHTQDVAVIFTALTPTAYYDNGQHY